MNDLLDLKWWLLVNLMMRLIVNLMRCILCTDTPIYLHTQPHQMERDLFENLRVEHKLDPSGSFSMQKERPNTFIC